MGDENPARAGASGFADRYETLSVREREIFQLIAEARSNKEVAALLDISPATVETHRANLMQKLNATNSRLLLKLARQNKLIE